MVSDRYPRYFGRAKELPGVKELFQSRAKEEDEEMKASAFYKKFTGQGPSYFGDFDEKDGSLVEYETQLEEEGTSNTQSYKQTLHMVFLPN